MSGSYFRERRNVQLSVKDHLETQINASWSGVTVVKSYLEVATASLPIVCVESASVFSDRLEVGTDTRVYDYLIEINVFTSSDAVRMDMVDFILNSLSSGCIYYEYTKDDDYNISGTANGRLSLRSVNTDTPVSFEESPRSKEKHRHQLIVVMRRS